MAIDNIKNVLNAINLLTLRKKNDLRCAAHMLQLAVNSGIK